MNVSGCFTSLCGTRLGRNCTSSTNSLARKRLKPGVVREEQLYKLLILPGILPQKKERKENGSKWTNKHSGGGDGGGGGGQIDSVYKLYNNEFLLFVFSSFSAGIARALSTSICLRSAPPTSHTATAVPRPQPPKTPLRPMPIPSLPSTWGM